MQNQPAGYRVAMGRTEVQVLAVCAGRLDMFSARLEELGSDGADLWSPRSPTVGDPLRLSLPAWQGGTGLVLLARVLQSRPQAGGWRVGIQFTSLKQSERDQLARRVTAEQRRQLARRSLTWYR